MKKIMAKLLRKERQKIKDYYELKKNFENYLESSKRHLDFGCGFGTLPYLIACEHPEMKVKGIDTKKDEITTGKKRYIAPNLMLNISNKVNGKFDTISTFFVLHEIIGDLDKHLKVFYSHLNKHGKIIIEDARKVSKKRFMKFYYKPRLAESRLNKAYILKSFEEEYKHNCKFNSKQIISTLEKAGFKTLRIKFFETSLLYIGEKK